MASRYEEVRRDLLHRLGEPCDICDGGGLDYIGRECRRWDKAGDPNYPPPAAKNAVQERIPFFGGPLNDQRLAVPASESVVLAPVPKRVSFSLTDPLDPLADTPLTMRYDIERLATTDGRDQRIWRVAVAEGFPRHRITDAMNAVLALCWLPICAARHHKIAP